jgi:hypothetical protein
MVLIALAVQAAIVSPVEPVAESEPPAVVAAVPTTLKLPALTNIRIRVLVDLASKQSLTGDEFEIALVEPIAVADGYVVPAGTRGRGWVIHADKAQFGGKPGELLLGARFLDLGGHKIPLRSMKLGAPTGKDNVGLAMGVAAVAGVAGMFITGGQARVGSGMEAIAKTATDVDLPVALLTRDERKLIPVHAISAPPATTAAANADASLSKPE